jgi:hypothetical protein
MWMRLILIITLAISTSLAGQTPASDPTRPLSTPDVAGTTGVDREVTVGGMFGTDDISAKFNEYRDLGSGIRVFDLRLLGYTPAAGRYLESFGRNLGGDDQFLSIRGGQYGTWSASLEFDSLPHRLSNNAFSPYTYAGNGLFTVPGVVGILTSTADNMFRPADMLENDRRIDAYLRQYLRPLPEIGTQSDALSLNLAYAPTPAFEARLAASREAREGQKITYGPLGDRPPRTLNVEIPEPIDYDERTLQFEMAYAHRLFDVTFELFAPRFENNIDTMRWQSMYFGPDSDGALDYNNDIILAGDAIVRRAVSTVGQRPLFPDNRFTNATLSFGADGPFDGRFTATAALGNYRQNETLLPYSYSTLTTNWNSTSRLPRLTADSEMNTLLVDLQYVLNPVRGLRIRPFVRSYTLENDTPQDNWWYVTQDTASNTTGSATYKNKRTNLAYAFERQNVGVETTWQARAATFGLRLEKESIDRDFREADTDELIARFTASFRPIRRLSLRGRYTYGKRDADNYNNAAPTATYWYAPTDVTDADNPRFTFTNHPDMRRYDVSDRRRNEFDVIASYTPVDSLSLSASFMFREHDFDSNVRPTQPLAGTSFASASGVTPGIQLGLLSQETSRLSFETNWTPSDRWGANAFISVDAIDVLQSNMAYNENSRTNAQTPQLSSAGQAWIDERSIWRAAHDDRTVTFGAGFNYTFIPDRLNLTLDYALSNGTVDIDYSGYGSTQPLTTTYYAWRSPDTVEHIQHTANLGVEYTIRRNLILGLGYLFDDYSIKDWMQEPTGGWVDVVNDYFIRDSTRDNRWGNRLPRLGGYLAPSYNANVGFVTLSYRW